MSTHELIESEYDKAGDFYINWLDKNVPERDTQIQPSIEIMLAMLGESKGPTSVTWGVVKGICLGSLQIAGHSLRASTPPGFC